MEFYVFSFLLVTYKSVSCLKKKTFDKRINFNINKFTQLLSFIHRQTRFYDITSLVHAQLA